ncbi:MAG: ribulose-phosphate 3-epimerase [Anaerolineaceae bacterium]
MSDLIISASILSADFTKLGDQIHSCEESNVDWIHIDVMDGHFVPNITMGPFIVEHCKRMTKLPLDVHLMIEKPENLVDAFIDTGANYLSVHIEGNPLVQRTLNHIRSRGCHPGIALTPSTPASMLESILPDVDFVLVMTVNPGFSGQSFQTGMTDKIQNICQMIEEKHLSVALQVDGGINATTLPIAYRAGARIAVAATAIFGYPEGISAGVNALRKSIL